MYKYPKKGTDLRGDYYHNGLLWSPQLHCKNLRKFFCCYGCDDERLVKIPLRVANTSDVDDDGFDCES